MLWIRANFSRNLARWPSITKTASLWLLSPNEEVFIVYIFFCVRTRFRSYFTLVNHLLQCFITCRIVVDYKFTSSNQTNRCNKWSTFIALECCFVLFRSLVLYFLSLCGNIFNRINFENTIHNDMTSFFCVVISTFEFDKEYRDMMNVTRLKRKSISSSSYFS